MRAIALGVCDYLAESTSCPTQLSRMTLEGSIIPIVEDMFLEGLAHHGMAPGADTPKGKVVKPKYFEPIQLEARGK